MREMEVRKWMIEFKPSDHIRELGVLFTIFTLSFIGILIIVTNDRNEKITNAYSNYTKAEANDRNEKITNAYSNYTKAEAVEYVNGQFSKLAEMGAGSGTRPSLPTSSVGSVAPDVLVNEPRYVVEKSNPETPLNQNQPVDKSEPEPVDKSEPEPVDKSEPEPVDKIKPEPVTVRPDVPYLSPTSSPQILLPFVIKSIPQSPTDDEHTPTINTSSGTLEGVSGQFDGTKLDVFLGVPYAQATDWTFTIQESEESQTK